MLANSTKMTVQTVIAKRSAGFTNLQIFNLLIAIVIRDLRGRYTRSFLGPLWAILQPLMLMVVFTLIRGVLDISTGETPYFVFSYVALVPWTFFQSATRMSGNSIFGGGSIMKKIAIPREIFPAAAVVTAAFDMLMSGTILIGMLLFFRIPITIQFLWVPVLLLLTGILAWGLGLGIAALGTYRRDFLIAAGFGLQLLTYATPIIYPLSEVPEEWLPYFRLNPLVGLIENYRAVIIDGTAPDFGLLGITVVMTIIVCAVTWPFFRMMSQYFADVL